MTLPLPANWATGQEFTADAENSKEAAINAMGAGTLPIPLNVLTSSASSLTLTTGRNAYVFTGTAASVWTLPIVSGALGAPLDLCNRGSAAVTVKCAGTDQLYEQGATSATTTIPVGGSLSLVDDGTYWVVLES